MKTLNRNAPRQNPPAYARVLEAAMGEQPWTPAELAERKHSPQWLIAEAHAHVELALLETDEVARDLELRSALASIIQLPTANMQATCFELLQTYLPEEAQERFAQLFHATRVSPATQRRAFTWQIPAVGLVAASLATVIVILSTSQSPPLPVELAQTVIETHGSIDDQELLRGDDASIYSDEAFVYQAEVKTMLPQAWLLHFRDVVDANGKIHLVVRPFENTGGFIHIQDQPPRQAIDCLDYYLVVVPQQPQALDAATHGSWLASLRAEVLRAGADKFELSQIEQIVRRHWLAAGFTGEVKLHIDRFVRHREPRS